IDVKAVTRTLPLAHAGQGAIETVAEPVQCQAPDGSDQPQLVEARKRVTDPGCHLGGKAEDGEVVGVDVVGGPLGQPDENAFFMPGQDTFLQSFRLRETSEFRANQRLRCHSCLPSARILANKARPAQSIAGKAWVNCSSVSKLLESKGLNY